MKERLLAASGFKAELQLRAGNKAYVFISTFKRTYLLFISQHRQRRHDSAISSRFLSFSPSLSRLPLIKRIKQSVICSPPSNTHYCVELAPCEWVRAFVHVPESPMPHLHTKPQEPVSCHVRMTTEANQKSIALVPLWNAQKQICHFILNKITFTWYPPHKMSTS